MAPDSTDVGERMRQAREVKGLSQTELGRLLGVTQQSVAKIEAGGNTSPGNWSAIADALDTTTDALFGRSPGLKMAARGGSLEELAEVDPKEYARLQALAAAGVAKAKRRRLG